MTGRYSRPQRLEPTPEIFDELSYSFAEFSAKTRKHYAYVCHAAGYEPVLNDGRLEDAWVFYRRDKKYAANSMPKVGVPNYFELCGILAYWLCRFAPVYDLRDLSMAQNVPEVFSGLLKKFPSELLAFDMGLALCDFFENNKEKPSGTPAVGENKFSYYKEICYVMKFKNMPPHSTGMIYRSLYVPVHSAD
ncbi:MAG: hypothetical protein HAW59_00870 [Betaproteobacteria bacterium]|nr:hypothetical protein [Betaproteobacteria bacterium]